MQQQPPIASIHDDPRPGTQNESFPTYWMGGSPSSGKSTITEALAARFGLQVYRCDDAHFQTPKLISPECQPIFAHLTQASCDEIWMRPVAQQIDEELALYREEFPLILSDLANLLMSGPVIAEGAALLPELVDAFVVRRDRSIWIVPTEYTVQGDLT